MTAGDSPAPESAAAAIAAIPGTSVMVAADIPASDIAIEVEGLTKSFGGRVVVRARPILVGRMRAVRVMRTPLPIPRADVVRPRET